MNRALTRVYWVLAALFLLVLGMTAYWQIWDASSLAARRDNQRQVVRELSIKRGLILASDGAIIARNYRAPSENGGSIYERRYPSNLYAAPIGYSSPSDGRAGLERSANDFLTGANSDLAGSLRRQFSSLAGGVIEGNTVETSLSPAVQRAAREGLQKTGLRGAVVAIEPRTGRVLALDSWPTYNPNAIVAGKLPSVGDALFNRATQGRYPPGSAFKPLTTVFALESGRYTPDSVFINHNRFDYYGQTITNASPAYQGPRTLTESLTYSLNTTFAEIGAKLCARSVCPDFTRVMQAFGLFSAPPLDFPGDQLRASGILRHGTSTLATPSTSFDPARTAFGQGDLVVTPLQMALLAAGIGNDGIVMQPTLIDRVRTQGGKTISVTKPKVWKRATTPEIAREVRQMMVGVVTAGSGQLAQIPGVAIAGKTGTAQTGRPGLYDSWFIAVAPAGDPQIAVAVVIEGTPQFGGQTAAPIAKSVMQAVVGGG